MSRADKIEQKIVRGAIIGGGIWAGIALIAKWRRDAEKADPTSGINGMSKERARTWLENRGYRVVYQMGSYPTPGFYMAIPSGPWGQILRGSLNGIVEQVKRRERYGY